MEYNKHNIGPYQLHTIKTKKFKTISVLLNFKRPLRKEEITKRSFLNLILIQATKNYPTRRLLSIRVEELYGLDIANFIQQDINNNSLTFFLSMLNEKWTAPGMYEAGLSFLGELIFNPNLNGNKFCEKTFNVVKQELKNRLNGLKDNKREYAQIRMLEEMDRNEGIPYRAGYLEDLETITPTNLYEYYLSVLKSDLVDIFILGDIDVNKTKKIIKDIIPINTIKRETKHLTREHYKIRKRLRIVKEQDDINQAKLVIGCKLTKLTSFEKRYVMLILVRVLGGSGYSKLFRSVREKQSLAYYVNCQYEYLNQLLIIEAGINQADFPKTLYYVKKELQQMVKGNITKEELITAQSEYISTVQLILDNPETLINAYLTQELLKTVSLAQYIENVKKVTINDLKKVSKKLKIDTVYLLYGDDNNEED